MLCRWWYNTRLTRLVKSESVTLHSVGNGITTTMQQQQGLPQPPSGWRAEILCREQSISTEATPCFDNLTTQQREGSTFSWEFLKFQQLGGFWGSMQLHGSELLRGRVVHLHHSVTPTSVLWPGRATSWCSTLPPFSWTRVRCPSVVYPMSLFGLDRVLGRMDAFLSLRKASITYPTAATIKRMLKSNSNKTTRNWNWSCWKKDCWIQKKFVPLDRSLA